MRSFARLASVFAFVGSFLVHIDTVVCGQDTASGAQAPGEQKVGEQKVAADESDRVQSKLGEHAREFHLTTNTQLSTPLALHSAPLLSYTNPIRARGQSGAIFLWTESNSDRPLVIGSLWKFRGKGESSRLSVELHSVSQASVHLTPPSLENPRRALPQWNAPSPAVTWESVPNAPISKTLISNPNVQIVRRQVRRQAGRFSANLIDPESRKEQPLRLLTKPLYEYTDEGVAYGAIFAFVMATDPEVFLCLEARKVSETIQLEFTLARMTGRELTAAIDNETVWRVERANIWNGSDAYYFCPNAAAF